MCGGGGRLGGQDLPPHLLHHQRFPRRVHPHRVRRLLHAADGGRHSGHPGFVGHSGPGGI